MPRILLLLPTATYRATDFLAAAEVLDVDVVVGSERRQALADSMGDRAVVVPLTNLEAALEAITDVHHRIALDAVVAVDDQGLAVASAAAQRLGLLYNRPDGVAATRDKTLLRERLATSSVPQPEYRVVEPGGDVLEAVRQIGYPCVLKPVSRSASQGVMRVNDEGEAVIAIGRLRAILGDRPENVLVEGFVGGAEVALEGLLVKGHLEVLAIFDKPDPLDGPFFEETIYVTPSRQSTKVQLALAATAARAADALGLSEGPVHVEMRVSGEGEITVLELAARSIGGLCSRALRFGAGVSLEELIIRHALGLGLGEMKRESMASGVMMLPIRHSGTLVEVSGREEALGIDGVVGLEITIAPGRPLVPLPEGDRYLGFLFARGSEPADVERSLRRAEACLHVRLE